MSAARRQPAVRRGVVLAALVALPAIFAVSCGGGGGTPTGPPPPGSSIVFTPAGGGSVVLASGAGSQGTTLVLEVRTTGIQDLYGIAFHLSYPSAALRYTGVSEGTVLNGGGTVQTSLQVANAPVGNLVVGLSRLGAVPGTSAAGTLLSLQFAGVATGSGSLAFSSNQANDSQGNVVQGLTWSGGAVQVTLVPGSR